ncbi:MAG: prepilin-type N-terminal cleavage/methylation domain-containing protein, partial [Planctomycetota bacterium]|nr:prepilin-type N-terminal cleavage/methylation domain-containing protein [Planctomycetota bacterium]
MQLNKCVKRTARRKQRQAFTLFEILIVLTVVIILGAIAYPAVSGMTGVESLLRSGDQVRIHLARSRNQAMRSGQTLALRYELQGNRYIIEPWTTGDEFLEAGATTDAQPLVDVMG